MMINIVITVVATILAGLNSHLRPTTSHQPMVLSAASQSSWFCWPWASFPRPLRFRGELVWGIVSDGHGLVTSNSWFLASVCGLSCNMFKWSNPYFLFAWIRTQADRWAGRQPSRQAKIYTNALIRTVSGEDAKIYLATHWPWNPKREEVVPIMGFVYCHCFIVQKWSDQSNAWTKMMISKAQNISFYHHSGEDKDSSDIISSRVTKNPDNSS